MYIVYGTNVGFTNSKTIVAYYQSLPELQANLENISCNFIGSANTVPIQKNPSDTEYAWVQPCSFENCEDIQFPVYQINRIDTDFGTVFSDGKFTNNRKFCAKTIANWFQSLNKAINKEIVFTERAV